MVGRAKEHGDFNARTKDHPAQARKYPEAGGVDLLLALRETHSFIYTASVRGDVCEQLI